MKETTSVFLDAVRFLAALVVFVGHLSGARLTAGIGWQASDFMNDAVAVFFVLSGFVISFATDGREATARSYAVARLARVASVAVPALAVTFLLDAVGRSLAPAAYDPSWGYVWDGRLGQLVLSATFLSQAWVLDVAPGSDLPWWSLAYEVPFYVAFGAFLFGGRWRYAAAGLVLVAVGPAVVSLFPLWLGGVALHGLMKRHRLRVPAAAALAVVVLACSVAFAGFARHLPSTAIPGITRHLDPLRAYLVGVLFAASILAADGLSGWAAARRVASLMRPAVRQAASVTFTLYLVHLPVAQFVTAVAPGSPASLVHRVLVYGVTALAVVAVAVVGERRKSWWAGLLSGRAGQLGRA